MADSVSSKYLSASVLVAGALWFLMFSPWTAGILNFWLEMTCAAVILTTLALAGKRPSRRSLSGFPHPFVQIITGIGLAFALWGIFWIGDVLSGMMFDFAGPQVDSVYAMKTGLPSWAIAILLLLVIGPAEEFFWRGFVQRNVTLLMRRGDKPQSLADFAAFALTTTVYALIHIWSMNFMLVMAALVAGAVWGFVYMLRPKLLPALIISHSLWDALVFVILPIGQN